MKRVAQFALAVTLSVAGATAVAQSCTQLRWVVPYPAGGGSDFLARTIGQALSTELGHPVVIDNKPGANTAIGASDVARATPDGCTVLSADNGTMVNNPVLYKQLAYDPDRDLLPVSLMGRFPMILVVSETSPYQSAEEFIAAIKARPGEPFASAGAGSPHHLAMELMAKRLGLTMTHVGYRGAAPALMDVASGQVGAMMTDLAAGRAMLDAGKVRPLAVANAERLTDLPNVPTFAELGYPDIEAAALVGMVVPAGTSDPAVENLSMQVAKVLKDEAVASKLLQFGVQPVGSTPEQYEELLQSERTRWQGLIRDLNLSLD